MQASRLATSRALAEARRLYETAGFLEVAPFSTEPCAGYRFRRDLSGSEER
jgi:hypothetical protein